jgi:hypothetical protein
VCVHVCVQAHEYTRERERERVGARQTYISVDMFKMECMLVMRGQYCFKGKLKVLNSSKK